MRNPQDFVGYVIMVRGKKNFNPQLTTTGNAVLYMRKAAATTLLAELKKIHGARNVYLQQYGPYR